MRKVTGIRLATRLESWVDRLVHASVQTVAAAQLYSGGHWDIVRRLPDVATAPIAVWVVSAGYGLIPATAPVKPYAATFDVRHTDSVLRGGIDPAAWWEALAQWDGPSASPRTLAELVTQSPDARVIVVLSETYLAACLPDVLAATRLSRPDQLSIICTGARRFTSLRNWLIPSDARLQNALGGARHSLNVRLAAHLLGTGAVSHESMSRRSKALLAQQPPLLRYARQQLTDAQVRKFIQQRLRAEPGLSRTRLLRQLRDDGFACEQERFTGLFAAETGGAS